VLYVERAAPWAGDFLEVAVGILVVRVVESGLVLFFNSSWAMRTRVSLKEIAEFNATMRTS
jgi:hypothetical protein